jgi:hypothetical protein
LAGGGVPDLAWHGTDRRRRPRIAPTPEEYDLVVLSPREFDELVDAVQETDQPSRRTHDGF